MEDNVEPTAVTRRNVIKGGVAAGAAVWTAPLVSSFTSPARAAGSEGPSGCTNCGPDQCAGQPDCGGGCLCSVRADGNGCVCAQPTFCDNPLCGPNLECPDGTVCLATCCADLRCFVPCGQTAPEGFAARHANTGQSSAPR
jgi:hypothetical protein